MPVHTAMAHFSFKPHGFYTSYNLPTEVTGFLVLVCFPSLRKEYQPCMEQLGCMFGTGLETSQTAASVLAKAAGIPSVRVLLPDAPNLTNEISLPTLGGG